MGLRLVVIGKGKPTCISSFPHFGTPSSPAGFKQRTACIQKPSLPAISTTDDESDEMEDDLGKVARVILNNPDAVDPNVLAGQYDE